MAGPRRDAQVLGRPERGNRCLNRGSSLANRLGRTATRHTSSFTFPKPRVSGNHTFLNGSPPPHQTHGWQLNQLPPVANCPELAISRQKGKPRRMGFQTPSVSAMACTHTGTDSTELLYTVLTASVQSRGHSAGAQSSSGTLLPTHLSPGQRLPGDRQELPAQGSVTAALTGSRPQEKAAEQRGVGGGSQKEAPAQGQPR